MSTLKPCPQCHRHFQVDDQTCPFCARSSSKSRMPRAAVLAGVLASSTLMGCPKSVAPGAAPDGSDQAVEANTTEEATADDETKVDEAEQTDEDNQADETDEEVKVEEDNVEDVIAVEPDREPPPMPYGAPPSRRRRV